MSPRSFPWLVGWFGLPLLVASLHAQSFVEDFSALSNGTGEGAAANIKQGETHGWNGRGLETWQIEDSSGAQKKVLKSLMGLPNWHALGRTHGLDLNGATAVDITMTTIQAKSHSATWVWLADELQNGYGVEYMGFNRGVRVFKLRDGVTPFSDARDSASWVSETAKSPTGEEAKIVDPIDDGSLVTIYLRVAQEKAGAPVTLTAWSVSDSGVSSSYDQPVTQVVDDGSGSTFTSAKGFGPVFDLSALTYLAFSAATGKDGLPVLVNVGAEVVKKDGAGK